MRFLNYISSDQIISGKVVKKSPKGKLIIDTGGGRIIATGHRGLDVGDGVTLLRLGKTYQVLSSFIASHGRTVREEFIRA